MHVTMSSTDIIINGEAATMVHRNLRAWTVSANALNEQISSLTSYVYIVYI